jgi:hypothetical protein
MAQNTDRPDEPDATPSVDATPVQECVQELTWALIDDQISDDEMRLLDTLLLSDDDARTTYVGCMQLHTNLIEHFSPTPVGPTKATVLGFLQGIAPNIGVPPAAEDSVS